MSADPAKEPRFASEVIEAMGDEGAAALLDANHRPVRALALLSGAMDRLPIDEKKKVEVWTRRQPLALPRQLNHRPWLRVPLWPSARTAICLHAIRICV